MIYERTARTITNTITAADAATTGYVTASPSSNAQPMIHTNPRRASTTASVGG